MTIIINNAQIIVAVLIILLVLVTFYRLIHVWAYTLNFSEVILYQSDIYNNSKHVHCTGEYPGTPGLGRGGQLGHGEGEPAQQS